jgi:equilibrative nucleoside transporter 1/2/3
MSEKFPIDPKNLAYIIMFYEGVGNLFPWNAFITASSYYANRFCGTAFETTFENYFSITYTLSQTIGLAFSILYADRFTLKQRIVIPLLLWAAIFAATSGLVGVTAIDPNLLFGLTIISAFLCGVFGASLSGGLFSLGAMLPPAYTGAIMNGQGLAGLIVSVSALLTMLAATEIDTCDDDKNGDDAEDCSQYVSYSALAYFLIATFVLLSCAMAYYWLQRMAFTRYFLFSSHIILCLFHFL